VNSSPILPYYHPTTVVIVDDNDLFLHTLDLRMPSTMAYLMFHDARAALERVNLQPAKPAIPQRCLSAMPTESTCRQSLIRLELGLIEDEIKNSERFTRTSVVIVDYAMPEMDGLEFCSGIQDPSVKKVLLTGVADEKLAVRAFNEGVIDRFLPKAGDATLDHAVTYAQQLQRSFFVDQQRAFSESLALAPRFLADQAMSSYFDFLCGQLGIVEHYLVGDPPGFLMLTSAGEVIRLVVLSEEDVDRQVDFAERFDAPQAVVHGLQSRRQIACFFEAPDPHGDAPFGWAEYLHDARVIRSGARTWYTAVIRGLPRDVDFDPATSSFDSHLDSIDHLAQH
jgi:CheY-like chemotaxis protein